MLTRLFYEGGDHEFQRCFFLLLIVVSGKVAAVHFKHDEFALHALLLNVVLPAMNRSVIVYCG